MNTLPEFPPPEFPLPETMLPETMLPEMTLPGRQWVFGIAYDMLDLDEVVALCAARPATAPFAYLATPNATHVVRVYRGDEVSRRGLDAAWLLINDSRVVQRILRMLLGQALPLATGSDLTQRLFEGCITAGDAITIIGGDAAMTQALQARYRLDRVAQFIPPFGFAGDRQEVARCVEFVMAHPARFVFLACGAPQSEWLGAAICAAGDASGLGLCIGASLQFLTGQRRRAPAFVQQLSLEWLFRLLQEPRRLGRRLWSVQLPFLMVALHYRLAKAPAPPAGRRTAAGPGPG